MLKCDVSRAGHMCAIMRVILYRMCCSKYHGAQPGFFVYSRHSSFVTQRPHHAYLLHLECSHPCMPDIKFSLRAMYISYSNGLAGKLALFRSALSVNI